MDPPHDCESEGHEWRRIGTAKDGTTFFRCMVCGIETEG